MEGYGQFCPVAKAMEVVGSRWTVLILREMLVGSTRFNEIRRGVPTCSPTLLSKRLKDLERSGVVRRCGSGNAVSYRLTEAGQDLLPIVLGLGEWGQRWVRSEYGPDELDPGLLMWDVRRYLAPGVLGTSPVTLQFVFPAAPVERRFYWLVIDDRDVDLCLVDPGREVDVTVEADLRALTQVWMGDAAFDDAIRDGRIVLRGPSSLTRRIPTWFGQHPYLSHVKPATTCPEVSLHQSVAPASSDHG